MPWSVSFHDEFDSEFATMPEAVQDGLLALARLLTVSGPRLGRPHADTLAGSRHADMKELRFTAANGAWRVAFASDPERNAILLMAGDKAGVAPKRFYRALIAKADRRFENHLAALASERE